MTSLTLVRRIVARPSIVFDALTTADGIAAWWGPDDLPVTLAEIDARVGGACRVCFRTLDGKEHEAGGVCLEINRPVRLVMSWRWVVGGHPAELGQVSRIEINLRVIENGTELTFTHAGLADVPSQKSHERGWAGSLAKLTRHLKCASRADRRAESAKTTECDGVAP